MTSNEQALALLMGSFDLQGEAMKAAVEQYKKDLFVHSVAPNTLRNYLGDWKHFRSWSTSVGIDAETIQTPEEMETALLLYSHYFLHHPDPKRRLKPVSMSRYLTGIRWVAVSKGLPWPAVHPGSNVTSVGQAMSVAHRQLGTPPNKAAPISTAMLTQMVALCPDNPKGVRDKSVLLLGFCSAMRRSEIAGLNIEDLRLEDEGIVITLTKSKTDQQGHGRKIWIPRAKRPETCPVISTLEWLKIRDAKTGPLFVRVRSGGILGQDHLSHGVIDVIVKTYASKVDALQRYSAHSLRSGLATSASRGGADLKTVMRQTGHTSVDSVMGYIHEATGFTQNVMSYLDL